MLNHLCLVAHHLNQYLLNVLEPLGRVQFSLHLHQMGQGRGTGVGDRRLLLGRHLGAHPEHVRLQVFHGLELQYKLLRQVDVRQLDGRQVSVDLVAQFHQLTEFHALEVVDRPDTLN